MQAVRTQIFKTLVMLPSSPPDATCFRTTTCSRAALHVSHVHTHTDKCVHTHGSTGKSASLGAVTKLGSHTNFFALLLTIQGPSSSGVYHQHFVCSVS